jgi:competence protein ComEC
VKTTLRHFLPLCLCAFVFVAQSQSTKTLDIYVVDVEGGNATLFVSPSGESLLMDTGHLGAAERDAGRIMAAINDAGLRQIDHLVTTHWHLDHFGGMSRLAARISVREFIDHGPNTQPKAQTDTFLQQTYPRLYSNAKHTVVKAGDSIPVEEIDVRVVASAGETIKSALPGAGNRNTFCDDAFEGVAMDRSENSQSIGLVMTFGKFRVLHLGDLSADKELELMCPDNRLGNVDVFIVSHHGQPNSNTEALVHAIESRAAIMNNSTRKGGEAEVMKVIHAAPGLEDLWQMHFSQLSGQEYRVPESFVANLTGKHNGTAYWIKVSAQADGAFTIVNSRNGFSKTYPAREK